MSKNVSLAHVLISECQKNGWKVVTAESCTGGSLAALLARTPGAGDVFFGGFVSYGKGFKTHVLGVPSDLIKKTTAVSEQVAHAMAWGALSKTRADLSMAITGVAGPKPDDDGNPVGCFHVVAIGPEGAILHRHCELAGREPDSICDTAIAEVLGLAVELLRST